MKKLLGGLVVTLVAIGGCAKESPRGGPGAVGTKPGNRGNGSAVTSTTTAPRDTVPGDTTIGSGAATRDTLDPGDTGAPTGIPAERDRVDTARDRDSARLDKDRDERTFTLKVPATATDIAQGGQHEIKISIDRGSNFNETVKLDFEAPSGITVDPASTELAPGEKEVRVTVRVADTAPLGKTSIEVIGMPETGKATSVSIPIDVDEKK